MKNSQEWEGRKLNLSIKHTWKCCWTHRLNLNYLLCVALPSFFVQATCHAHHTFGNILKFLRFLQLGYTKVLTVSSCLPTFLLCFFLLGDCSQVRGPFLVSMMRQLINWAKAWLVCIHVNPTHLLKFSSSKMKGWNIYTKTIASNCMA